jgi:hydroxymethylpyrimidine pyrophosphatase-like HAD family hydrolase
MLRYLALAVDFDGTIAHDGVVAAHTIDALARVRDTGRRLLLVTGRRLEDLIEHFPRLDLFDRVVAEDGAVVYRPATREERLLGEPPPEGLAAAMRAKGAEGISVGRVIVATWQPHEVAALEAIRELGLEHHIVFNKGAVMVLPPSINKATGLAAALAELGLSPHNVVAVGDAENDQAMLDLTECSVAVANALPTLKARADLVTAGDHGAGVVELVDQLLADDLAAIAPRLRRHDVLLGRGEVGEVVTLPVYGGNVLVAGSSGCGKSTLATGLLERLAERGYQFCLVDPEGDYEDFAGAVVLGDSQRAPLVAEVLQILEHPADSVVVNLLGLPNADRPAYFAGMLAQLEELRVRTGRPHWLAVDEAHYQLPAGQNPDAHVIPAALGGLLLITVHPDHLARTALDHVDVVVAMGDEPGQTLGAFASAVGDPPPQMSSAASRPGEAIVWRRPAERAFWVRPSPTRAEHHRHRRKYARGEIPPWHSFYFRGPEQRLNLRAQNLGLFVQLADGVDDETWLFHLHRGDYADWFRDVIKDEELASEATEIAANRDLSAAESRALVRAAIDSRYAGRA